MCRFLSPFVSLLVDFLMRRSLCVCVKFGLALGTMHERKNKLLLCNCFSLEFMNLVNAVFIMLDKVDISFI